MFEDNLKMLMKKQNISHTRLGELCGVSKQTVSAWCNGHKMPRMKMLMTICDVLQCPLKALTDPDPSSTREEIETILYRLSEGQLIQLLDYARYLESK